MHARRLLHLDVKPANIRVLDDARIVLLDFGSARDAFRRGNGPYGDTFTPGFAAVEQHHPDGAVTPATDVYGLAATLYFSLSLQVPTRADERQNGVELDLCPNSIRWFHRHWISRSRRPWRLMREIDILRVKN